MDLKRLKARNERLSATWIVSQPVSDRILLLDSMTDEEAKRFNQDWRFLASDAQTAPEGDWRIWLFSGGRGAGKTRAGAEWVKAQLRAGRRRIALIAPSHADVREVMVHGESGLIATHREIDGPPPVWEASRRRLVWANGAIASGFSAGEPDRLRGPQFDAAWGDEFAAWPRAQETLDMLRLGLRLGADPRLVLTTTPKPTPALKALMDTPGLVQTRQATERNKHHLAEGFLDAMQAAYGGSRLARQELEGELIEDPEGALWTRNMLERAWIAEAPPLDRVVVAIDPPASSHKRSDRCGIVVAGACGEGVTRCAFILADVSFGPAAPAAWARRACQAFEDFEADAIIAEANQGGEMVRAVLQAEHAGLPVRLVHASRGKHVRAEPVAALYEAARVRHAGRFCALEDEMCAFGAPGVSASPDRVDALVWAVTELCLGAAARPRLRRL